MFFSFLWSVFYAWPLPRTSKFCVIVKICDLPQDLCEVTIGLSVRVFSGESVQIRVCISGFLRHLSWFIALTMYLFGNSSGFECWVFVRNLIGQ